MRHALNGFLRIHQVLLFGHQIRHHGVVLRHLLRGAELHAVVVEADLIASLCRKSPTCTRSCTKLAVVGIAGISALAGAVTILS